MKNSSRAAELAPAQRREVMEQAGPGTHRRVPLPVLYFGTPVIVVSTSNPDGTTNLAPMSSAWWLGQDAMLGLSVHSQTSANLVRDGECVLNLVASGQVDHVDRLALTTGRAEVPAYKVEMGYRHVRDKFGVAGLTPVAAQEVRPARVAECPIQLEGRVMVRHDFTSTDGTEAHAFQVRVLAVHVDEAFLVEGTHHVDPVRWDPLIMKFTHYFGHGARLRPSTLAAAWGMPDVRPLQPGSV